MDAETLPQRSALGVVRSENYPGAMLTTDQKGAIAEAEITAAAVHIGVGVYKPLFEGGRCDLIFEIGRGLIRVQCKWAVRQGGAIVVRCYSSRRGPRNMIVRKYSPDDIDVIAAYCRDTGRCYVLPPALFSDRRTVYLRVAPSRNNQQAGINWADEFDLGARLKSLLGAVAQLGERPAGSREATGSSPVGSTPRPASRASLFGVDYFEPRSSSY